MTANHGRPTITFTDEETDRVRELVAAGDQLAANRLILSLIDAQVQVRPSAVVYVDKITSCDHRDMLTRIKDVLGRRGER